MALSSLATPSIGRRCTSEPLVDSSTRSSLYRIPRTQSVTRRQGIGSRLCEHATGLAWAFGRTKVVLETTDTAAFYARLGWTAVADTVVEHGSALALAVVMQRVVSTEPPNVDVMRRST